MRKRRRAGGLDERGASADVSQNEGPVSSSLVSLLVEVRVASEPELRRVAAEADAQGIGFGELVVARGLLDEEGMARLVARQAGLPFLARGSLTIDPSAARLLSFEHAQTLRGCVTGIRQDGVVVVVDDPSSERLAALRAQLETTAAGASVSFSVVTASSLNGLLGQLARLSGRRPDPDRSPLARPAPAVGNPTEQLAALPASDDRLLAGLQRAAATEQALQARLDRLQTERDAAEHQGKQLRQQIEQLQQQLEAVGQQRVSERDHDSGLQARLDELEGERDAVAQQVEQLQQQLAAVGQQRVSERDADSGLRARLDELEAERESARQQGEQLQQQVEQLQQQLEAVDQQRVSERDHGSQLQARLDQLESERDAVAQQVEELQQQLEAADQLRVSERDNGSELQVRLDELRSERESANQQAEQLQQQVEQLQQQLEAVEQERVSERDADGELQARLDQLESERDAATQQAEQLQQQVEQLQQQLQVVDEQRVSERDHGSQLQARLDQLESERDAAVQQIEQLQEQLEVARQQASERDYEPKRHIHALTQPDGPAYATSGGLAGEVPLINVRLIEGVFSRDERRQLAKGLITAVVGVKGESFRDQAEVLIAEVPVGNRYERDAAIAPEEADAPH